MTYEYPQGPSQAWGMQFQPSREQLAGIAERVARNILEQAAQGQQFPPEVLEAQRQVLATAPTGMQQAGMGMWQPPGGRVGGGLPSPPPIGGPAPTPQPREIPAPEPSPLRRGETFFEPGGGAAGGEDVSPSGGFEEDAMLRFLGLTSEQMAQYKSLGMSTQDIIQMVSGGWQGPREEPVVGDRQALLDETLAGGGVRGPDLSGLEADVAAGKIPPPDWFQPGENWADPNVKARWQAEQGGAVDPWEEMLRKAMEEGQGISEYEQGQLEQRQAELEFKERQFGELSASEQAELAQIRYQFQQQQAARGREAQAGLMSEQDRLAWEKERYRLGQTQEARLAQLGYQQRQEELGATQDWRQWQIGEAGRQADVEQQNYLARLAAQPKSWLEYSAAAGQQAAVQPWMLPLMSQQNGMQQAGQAIPGWSPTSMTGMPELLNPSRQLQATMQPSEYQQYLGYQQAQTGQTPQDVQMKLWQQAPPSGGQQLVRRR